MKITDIYKVYIDSLLLPQTPESITTTPDNRNEVIFLANGEPFTLAKKEGPRTWEFEAEITQKAYPFTFADSLKNVAVYESYFEGLKKKQTPCLLTIMRTHGQPPTCTMCLLDDYKLLEDAKNASDWTYSFKLTEYHPQVNQELDSGSGSQLTVAGEARSWTDEVDKTDLSEQTETAAANAEAESEKVAAIDANMAAAEERARH